MSAIEYEKVVRSNNNNNKSSKNYIFNESFNIGN